MGKRERVKGGASVNGRETDRHGAMSGGSSDTYMMGRGESETKRLIRQSGFYGPYTWRLLTEAGLESGMKVLDVGTGAGDVALLAAELVGPEGGVVGLDQNPKVLETARARAGEAGLANATFVEGDIHSLNSDEAFDAVVGRFMLMYQPDPTETLRALVRAGRPGCVVAFQEMNPLSEGMVSARPTPLWEQSVARLHAVIERAGVETQMGYKLHGTYLDAGLPAPRMESNAPMGGPDWGGYEYFVETLRSLMPLVEKFGIATAEEVGIDTLAERLCEEAVASGGVFKTPDVVSAWAPKPL